MFCTPGVRERLPKVGSNIGSHRRNREAQIHVREASEKLDSREHRVKTSSVKLFITPCSRLLLHRAAPSFFRLLCLCPSILVVCIRTKKLATCTHVSIDEYFFFFFKNQHCQENCRDRNVVKCRASLNAICVFPLGILPTDFLYLSRNPRNPK